MIQRSGDIHVTGAHIGIWEEHVDEEGMREVFAAFRAHLESRGFVLAPDPSVVRQIEAENAKRKRSKKKRPDWLTPMQERFMATNIVGKHASGLEFDADTFGRAIKVNFWQEVTAPENKNGGRYDFHKLKRMPRALRLACIVEMVNAIRFFQSLGYAAGKNLRTLAQYPLPMAVLRIAEERADEGLSQLQLWERDTWASDLSKPRRPDGWPVDYMDVYNLKDRDGAVLEPGMIRHCYLSNGRLIQGRVYPHCGVWRLCAEDGKLLDAHNNKAFFTATEQTPRRRVLTRQEVLAKLDGALTTAQRRGNARRAEKVAVAIACFRSERLYYVLSLKERDTGEAILTWWRPNANGYCYRLEDAGRYLVSEIQRHRGYYDNGDSTKAIPCEVVEALSVQVRHVESRELESDRHPEERVVVRRHLAALRGWREGQRSTAAPVAQEGAAA